MTTVTVHRAGDTPGKLPIPPCTILIGESIETVERDKLQPQVALNALGHLMNYEADAIADALFDHLPQGVVQRISIRLQQRAVTNCMRGPFK
jgi:hypothetical protein